MRKQESGGCSSAERKCLDASARLAEFRIREASESRLQRVSNSFLNIMYPALCYCHKERKRMYEEGSKRFSEYNAYMNRQIETLERVINRTRPISEDECLEGLRSVRSLLRECDEEHRRMDSWIAGYEESFYRYIRESVSVEIGEQAVVSLLQASIERLCRKRQAYVSAEGSYQSIASRLLRGENEYLSLLREANETLLTCFIEESMEQYYRDTWLFLVQKMQVIGSDAFEILGI